MDYDRRDDLAQVFRDNFRFQQINVQPKGQQYNATLVFYLKVLQTKDKVSINYNRIV